MKLAKVLVVMVFCFIVDSERNVESAPRNLIDDMPVILQQLDLFNQTYGLDDSFDLGEEHLPLRASVLLMDGVLNTMPDGVEAVQLLAIYDLNLDVVEHESHLDELFEFRELVAALMSVGDSFQVAFKAFWFDLGAPLSGDYAAVQFEIPGSIEVEEPFSGAGDMDLDGFTNSEEIRGDIHCHVHREVSVDAALRHDNDLHCSSSGSHAFISCVIESAGKKTLLGRELDTIRSFRDRYLLTHPIGTALSDTYYRISAWWLKR
jgi:hypothetical protein